MGNRIETGGIRGGDAKGFAKGQMVRTSFTPGSKGGPMGLVRTQRRSLRQGGTTWDEAVAALGASPDVWWKFEASATEVPNDGSSTTVGPVLFDSTGNSLYFPTNSVSTANSAGTDSGTGTTFDSNEPLLRTSGTTGDAGILGHDTSTPATNGTIVLLCRTPMNEYMTNITPWFYFAGTSTRGMGLRTHLDTTNDDVRLQFRIRKASSNYIDRYWDDTDLGFNPGDGGYHLYILKHDASDLTLYADGTKLTTTTTTSTNGTGSVTDWIDEIVTNGGRDSFGFAAGVSGVGGFNTGDFDEFLFFEGYEITDEEASSLWDTVSSGAPVANWKRGWIGYLASLGADQPIGILNAYGTSSNFCADFGRGRGSYDTTPTGQLEGTPNVTPAGITSGVRASHYQSVATSSTAGEGSASLRLQGAEFLAYNSGSIIFHYQNTTDNAWNQINCAWTDRDDTITDAGETYCGVLTDGTFVIRMYDGTSATLYEYVYDFTNDGVFDLSDGTYYQIILDQPDDTNGWRMWINGTLIDYNDADVTQDSGNVGFFFADMGTAHTSSGASAAWSMGYHEQSSGTGKLSVEGYIGPMAITNISGYSQAQVNGLYEWVSDVPA